MSKNALFWKADVHDVIRGQEASLKRASDQLTKEQLGPERIEATKAQLHKQFDLPPCQLRVDKVTVTEREGHVQATRHDAFMYDIREGSRIKATFIDFIVPFTGDGRFFDIRPSQYSHNPPHADVQGQTLVFSYPVVGSEASEVKKRFEADLQNAQTYLAQLTADCEGFNVRLNDSIDIQLEARKRDLAQKSAFLEELGYPKA